MSEINTTLTSDCGETEDGILVGYDLRRIRYRVSSGGIESSWSGVLADWQGEELGRAIPLGHMRGT